MFRTDELAKMLGLKFPPPTTVADRLPDYDIYKQWAIINELVVSTRFRCVHCGQVTLCKVEDEEDNTSDSPDTTITTE